MSEAGTPATIGSAAPLPRFGEESREGILPVEEGEVLAQQSPVDGGEVQRASGQAGGVRSCPRRDVRAKEAPMAKRVDWYYFRNG